MYFDHGVNLSAVKKLLIYFLQKNTGRTRLEKGSSFYMDVSKNSDTPKSSIFNGVFHYFNHPCWGTSICIFGNTHIFLPISKRASFHRPNGTRTKKNHLLKLQDDVSDIDSEIYLPFTSFSKKKKLLSESTPQGVHLLCLVR